MIYTDNSEQRTLPQASEITVTIKDEEKTLKAKFLIYEPYTVRDDDEVIRRCINETMKGFVGEPDSVKIRINMEL